MAASGHAGRPATLEMFRSQLLSTEQVWEMLQVEEQKDALDLMRSSLQRLQDNLHQHLNQIYGKETCSVQQVRQDAGSSSNGPVQTDQQLGYEDSRGNNVEGESRDCDGDEGGSDGISRISDDVEVLEDRNEKQTEKEGGLCVKTIKREPGEAVGEESAASEVTMLAEKPKSPESTEAEKQIHCEDFSSHGESTEQVKNTLSSDQETTEPQEMSKSSELSEKDVDAMDTCESAHASGDEEHTKASETGEEEPRFKDASINTDWQFNPETFCLEFNQSGQIDSDGRGLMPDRQVRKRPRKKRTPKRSSDYLVMEASEQDKSLPPDEVNGIETRRLRPRIKKEYDEDLLADKSTDAQNESTSSLEGDMSTSLDGSTGTYDIEKKSAYMARAVIKGRRGRKKAAPQAPQCKLCQTEFSDSASFNEHLESHEEGGICCLPCRKEFVNYAVFLHHGCKITGPKRKKGEKRQCKICLHEFTSFKKLHNHMRFIHKTKADPEFFCTFCSRGFINKTNLFLHLRDVHSNGKIVCLKCGQFCDNDDEYQIHMDEHSRNALYECDKCKMTFTRRQPYVRHMSSHKKYDCSQCSSSFSRKKDLVDHVEITHGLKFNEEKKFFCDECGKGFHRPGQLEQHHRKHTGEKLIECPTCKIMFLTTKALLKHQKTLTHMVRAGLKKERNHLCSICGKAFTRREHLLRHISGHGDYSPHNCPHCEYKCREADRMKQHIRLHFSKREFVCEKCGAAFKEKHTLEKHHVYKHTDRREYPCTDCSKQFKTKSGLQRHQRTHSDARPHRCWCGTAFKHSYNLRHHMRTVHGSDASLPPPKRVKILDGQGEVDAPYAPRVPKQIQQMPPQPPPAEVNSAMPNTSVVKPHDPISSLPTMVPLSQPPPINSKPHEYQPQSKPDMPLVPVPPHTRPELVGVPSKLEQALAQNRPELVAASVAQNIIEEHFFDPRVWQHAWYPSGPGTNVHQHQPYQ